MQRMIESSGICATKQQIALSSKLQCFTKDIEAQHKPKTMPHSHMCNVWGPFAAEVKLRPEGAMVVPVIYSMLRLLIVKR